MNPQQQKETSKQLSYILRHRTDSVGLELQDGGWVHVDDLLLALSNTGKELPRDLLELIVAENDKQRFEFSPDRARIRARQGHSAEVDLGYEPATPPALLFHGTATRNRESILAQGLLRGQRLHVHLSTNRETMIKVAMRHGKPLLFEIQALRMHTDGFKFFLTANAVWLTDHVPPQYLTVCE